MKDPYQQAADLITTSDALIIAAGAGMGVDSGLPDFRGKEGFWKAYPALGKKGIAFTEIASPETFSEDPRLAWGFYGHRLQLYRQTMPHEGYSLLKKLDEILPKGAFVYTSNVDGQFQRAGFEPGRIVECHGSIHHLQCIHGCMNDIWSADEIRPTTHSNECKLISELPTCPYCGEVARPNILMFGDMNWIPDRCRAQEYQMKRWLKEVEHGIVFEIGAGTYVPSVRSFCKSLGMPIIRINPDDDADKEIIHIRDTALSAIKNICQIMGVVE